MTVQILIGDCIDQLKQLPDESVHCCVTSPPYWGLRDYGIDGQLGLEPSLGEHIEGMVEVFEQVRRVLRADGTLWLNYGDCYASSINGRSAADTKAIGNDNRTFRDKPFSTVGPIYRPNAEKAGTRGSNLGQTGQVGHRCRVCAGGTLKPKDLCMIPNRLAIALQDAGWWVRSEIIWHKPNPMPESIKDRPATSHEKIWLLTKSQKYFFDAEAIKEKCSPNTNARISQDLAEQEGSYRAHGGSKTNGPMRAVVEGSSRKLAAENDPFVGQKASREAALSLLVDKRNSRNVWSIPTVGFSDAHFATFPPALAERCILAGCPERGVVLDPFGGAGTTGLVADRLNRDAILIELNPEYAEMARLRIEGDAPLFTRVPA